MIIDKYLHFLIFVTGFNEYLHFSISFNRLSYKNVSPMTREKLTSKTLEPDNNVKCLVHEYLTLRDSID